MNMIFLILATFLSIVMSNSNIPTSMPTSMPTEQELLTTPQPTIFETKNSNDIFYYSFFIFSVLVFLVALKIRIKKKN